MAHVVKFASDGTPEVLEFKDVPEPQPAAGEVNVRVKAIGLNRAKAAAFQCSAARFRCEHRAVADDRSPRENPSGVTEKLSFAASSYAAHVRRMSLSNSAQAL